MHALAMLREAGPEGVAALGRVHADDLQRLLARPLPEQAGAERDREWARLQLLREAYDFVTGQRDRFASQLYWHRGLDVARARAAEENKPILSLRMLGSARRGAQLRQQPPVPGLALRPPRVRALLERKLPRPGSGADRVPRAAVLAKLEEDVAVDTLVNLYELRPRALRWLSDGPPPAFGPFNEKVYRELFLTPPEDAWLGLRNSGVFTGIEGDGVRR